MHPKRRRGPVLTLLSITFALTILVGTTLSVAPAGRAAGATAATGLTTSLAYSTYYGGAEQDSFGFLSPGPGGNLLAGGFTRSGDLNTTPGAFDRTLAGGSLPLDGFVARFDPAGLGQSDLVAATFLGGTDFDWVSWAGMYGGELVVVWRAASGDVPATAPCNDTTFGGGVDIAVAWLQPDLSAVNRMTFIGGTGIEGPQAATLDPSGNVWVVGTTTAVDYPTTPGAFQTAHADPSSNDLVISAVSADCQTLLYSTYLGGPGREQVGGVSYLPGTPARVAVSGYTDQSGFPNTTGAYDQTHNSPGMNDGFLTILSPQGAGAGDLDCSTYYGGSDYEDVYDQIYDPTSGRILLTGYSYSSDLPTTAGAYDTSVSVNDAFIASFSTDCANLLYGTYFGGSSEERGISISTDGVNVMIAGSTSSSNLPTFDPYDGTWNGSTDGFFASFQPDGNGAADLRFSTYFGGNGLDQVSAAFFDSTGKVYGVGTTRSTDLPTTPGAFDLTANNSGSNVDLFLVVLDTTVLVPESGAWTVLSAFSVLAGVGVLARLTRAHGLVEAPADRSPERRRSIGTWILLEEPRSS
jgi:hypothetical protein